MKRYLISLLVLSFFLFFPFFTIASDLSLEKGLQKTLEQSRVVLDQIKKKASDGHPIASELTLLSTLEDEIKSSHLLLQERFRIREEEVKAHGVKALKRHQEMSEGYSRALQDYLGLIEGLSSEGSILTRIDQIQSLLREILPQKGRPILGSLPYRNLKYPARAPSDRDHESMVNCDCR